jgi:hypothetical protein
LKYFTEVFKLSDALQPLDVCTRIVEKANSENLEIVSIIEGVGESVKTLPRWYGID